ncbi:MAG TPA: hypothetical protein VLF66_19490 [Thermoanaerobaculia bacterium]|nr:hypothetical protein [Thermoanaerobaculia bacterium]
MTVAFASLFLGLVAGVQPVALAVGEGVARVELLLDGELVGERTEPPWEIPCDFGDGLAPHELVAVARSAEGAELGRARQWINLPRSEAEATVVLEGAEDGRGAVARISWESLANQVPRQVTVTFDGRPLPVADPRAVPLPDHDPETLHLLRVELDFTANLSAVTELVFGGAYRADTATELTAVAAEVEGRRRGLEPADLAGRLATGGRPLVPVAVEEGPAEVVVVMDRAAQEALWELGRRWAPGHAGASVRSDPRAPLALPGAQEVRPSGAAALSSLRHSYRLAQEQSLRFLWPFSRSQEHGRVRYLLFSRSEDHPPQDGGVLWLLTPAQQPPFSAAEQRLADAVAVAGMSASARGRRRAVVLVLSEEPSDASRLAPAAVRRYLGHLGVPLFVWSVGPVSDEVAAAWGDVRPVDRQARFRNAVEELSESLKRQRIVWIEGLHLPQAVELTGEAEGVRLVR